MSPGKKTKLRTAGDVISRLKWADSSDNPAELIFMGYMDRIEGPMEKNVEDYVSAGNGGDIPEHRILYFRRSNGTITSQQQILWDRVGRVDRIFGSGDGRDAPVAPATIDVVRVAIANMRRIEYVGMAASCFSLNLDF